MAELTEYQTESYNIYVSKGIDEPTANKLATGKLSADDYAEILESKKINNEEQAIDQAGYSFELSDKTKKKVAKKQSDFAESAAVDDFSGESYMFTEYEPSKADVVKAYGINAEVKNELPKEVRFALSLGINNETLTLRDAKHLYINEYLLEDKKLNPELVKLHKDKIKFKYQKLNKNIFDGGKGEYNVLTYRVPKELGGTNKWTVTNSPTIIPTGGDLSAVAGDVFTVGSAVAGAIGGSFVTPVVGTSVGSAGATLTAEMTKYTIGREIYGLGEGLSDGDYYKMAGIQAGIIAGIDILATPAFLLTGAAIKKAVMEAAVDKISSKSIENLIKSGGKLDEGLLKNLDEAKKILKDHGIPEKVADDYLTANINKAFPEAQITGPKSWGTVVLAEIELAEKAVKSQAAEESIIKLVSGLDNVKITASQKDDIINKITNEIREIRTNELKVAKNLVEEAEGKVLKFKTSNSTVNEIDNLGVTFSNINQGIKKTLAIQEQKVFEAADNSLAKFNLKDVKDFGETKKILQRIIKEYSTKVIQKMKTPSLQNKLIHNKEYVKKWKANEARKDLYEALSGYSKRPEIVQFNKVLKKGIENIDNMTYAQITTWRKLIMAAESSEVVPTIRDALRKVKGTFKKALEKGLEKDTKLLRAHNDYDDLLWKYQSSFLKEFSDAFGYGSGNKVFRAVVNKGEGQNIFRQFTEGGDALTNAVKLRNIIDTPEAMSVANKNKIFNGLYEKYFQKVYKEPGSGKAVQSHKEFVEKYGAVYETILGKEVWAKFASSSKNALKVMDDAVENQLKVTKEISEALPGLSIKVIDNGEATVIVKHILSKMRGDNVSKLVSNLNKTVQGKEVLQDVRRVFVYDFLDQTKVNKLHNGVKLNQFLDDNKEAIEQLFNKEFLETYRSVAQALTALQDISFLGANASGKTVTEMANQAGLLIDVWAGPLNHKRLIINRLARLWDSFNLGGDNMALLLDYKMFIEAAKKHALGGNYHIMLDTLGASNKSANKTLLRKFVEILWGPTNYKGLDKKTAITKEYVKDKFEGDDRTMPDEPDSATIVDETLSRLGKKAKRDVYKNLKYLINRFSNLIGSGKDLINKDFEKEDYYKNKVKK